MGTAGTIAKNTAFNFVATGTDVLISLVIAIVLARSLGTEEYGLYALLMWFLVLATLISSLGLGEMARRFVAEAIGRQNTAEPKGIVRLTLLGRGLAALVVALAILAFSGLWAKAFAEPSHQIYFVLVAFALLPNALNMALISIFAGFQKYEYWAYSILATNPLRAVLVILFMVWGFGLQAVLILNIGIWALGVLIGVFLLRRLIPLRALFAASPLESAAKKRALKYALTLTGIMGVNYFLFQQAEVLFLGLYRPVEEVGFYTLACKLPLMAMMLGPIVLGSVLVPAISEQFGKGDIEKLKRIYATSARYLMMLSLPLAATGVALARPIISLLYGADYAPVVEIMQVLFIPFAMMGITHAATSVIYGINQPAFVLKVGLLLACLNVGLAIWLIPKYGLIGAAIGSSVPRLLALPAYIRFASKKIGVTWPVRDTAKIVLASSIMGLALFGLQNYLGVAFALALSVPLGVAVYVAAIRSLRLVHQQDLETFKSIQNSLPVSLRKYYAAFLNVAGRLVA